MKTNIQLVLTTKARSFRRVQYAKKECSIQYLTQAPEKPVYFKVSFFRVITREFFIKIFF
jgi:hypothetical protein